MPCSATFRRSPPASGAHARASDDARPRRLLGFRHGPRPRFLATGRFALARPRADRDRWRPILRLRYPRQGLFLDRVQARRGDHPGPCRLLPPSTVPRSGPFHTAALCRGAWPRQRRPGAPPTLPPDLLRRLILDPDGHNIEAVCHVSSEARMTIIKTRIRIGPRGAISGRAEGLPAGEHDAEITLLDADAPRVDPDEAARPAFVPSKQRSQAADPRRPCSPRRNSSATTSTAISTDGHR